MIFLIKSLKTVLVCRKVVTLNFIKFFIKRECWNETFKWRCCLSFSLHEYRLHSLNDSDLNIRIFYLNIYLKCTIVMYYQFRYFKCMFWTKLKIWIIIRFEKCTLKYWVNHDQQDSWILNLHDAIHYVINAIVRHYLLGNQSLPGN